MNIKEKISEKKAFVTKTTSSGDDNLSIKDMIKFELKSIIGRYFLSTLPPKMKGDKQYLNLGSSSATVRGWVNADFFCLRPKARLKFKKQGVNWQLDLRYTLHCDDNYFDGIFSEHVIEHLHSAEVINLLKELFRVLKPGCWLRISVPNLKKYVNYYCGIEVSPIFKGPWSCGAEAIQALTQRSGHQSVWDAELLCDCLKEVGFVEVKEMTFGHGTNRELIKEQEAREWESLYMEGRKSQ